MRVGTLKSVAAILQATRFTSSLRVTGGCALYEARGLCMKGQDCGAADAGEEVFLLWVVVGYNSFLGFEQSEMKSLLCTLDCHLFFYDATAITTILLNFCPSGRNGLTSAYFQYRTNWQSC